MKIHIPNSAFLGNIDQFLRSFDTSDPQKLEITAHKQWISIHPVVLAMITSLGLQLSPKDITCEKLEAKSKHYLKRMKLFELLQIDSGIEIVEHESAGRFIPLTQITDSSKLSTFITEMIPLLHLTPEQADPIRYVMSEITRNVFEHSASSIGAIVCAQYYPKSNTIRIGIVDRGVGIQQSIAQSHHVQSDIDAIRLALMPGITGTTKRLGGTEFNAGAGLFFTKSIAKVNEDLFMMYSGNAMYKLLKPVGKYIRLYGDPFKDNHSHRSDLPYWQGTAVGIDITLDNNGAFSSLLELIKDTYAKVIEERKKAAYKLPKFI